MLCTISWHTPVDALHSLENTRVTNAVFSLTKNLKGVKTYSFFDIFQSFSGWCGVRGSSVVTFSLRK